MVLDMLLSLEYNSYREEWEKDGQPHGFFWRPPETTWFSYLSLKPKSALGFFRLAFVWSLKIPKWMLTDRKAFLLVRLLRILVVIWSVSFIGLFIWLVGGTFYNSIFK
jgi:hypothetical protein